jgi:hypothetical protein
MHSHSSNTKRKMSKKGFKASGRMSVERFEKLFEQEFGVYCDIQDGFGDEEMETIKVQVFSDQNRKNLIETLDL